MRRSLFVALPLMVVASLLAGFLLVSTASAARNVTRLRATLTGPAEVNNQGVPNQGDPDGIGRARIKLFSQTGTICFKIRVKKIELPATDAHIHRGPEGVAGGIVVRLADPPNAPPDASGRSSGCVTANPTVFSQILANPAGFYVNVHNRPFPAGAVRGQLR